MLVEGTKSGFFHCRRKSRTLNNKKVLTNVDESTLRALDLKSFPIIADFEILITAKSNKTWGKHIYFYSAKRNEILTTFPWWDFAEEFLGMWDEHDIPIGTIDRPFFDLEQGWHIIIFEKRDYVYVLEGDEFCSEHNKIHTWYRVPKDVYYEQWKKLLNMF
ncbi:hypothetical protein [Anoxybacillus sp. TBDG-1]